MKNKIILTIITIALFISCSKDDTVITNLLDNVIQETAILRSIEKLKNPDEITDCDLSPNACVLTPTELIAMTPGNEINPINGLLNFSFEYQDDQNNELLKEVRMYVQLYKEQEIQNAISEKILIRTVTADQFTIFNETGLPRMSLRIEAPELYEALGSIDLPSINADRTGFVLVNFELELTNGRVITEADTSGSVETESFFNSPFRYRVIYLDFRTNP